MEGVAYPLNQNEYPSAPAYPLQHQSNPTEQYPAQQPGYIQPGYPPQQQYYPPQQQYYPSQQPGYSSAGYKGDAPPPYYAHQQALPQQQQSSTNVVVVQQQPTAVYTQTTVHASGDNFFTLSVVLTILCFLCGTWYSLLCTVPAIIFASAAKEAESRGNLAEASQKRNAALVCNITACVWWVIALILIVVPIAVIATRSSSSSSSSISSSSSSSSDDTYNYDYYDYNYDYCYYDYYYGECYK